MTLGEVLRLATGYLEAKGVETPRLDAELLLGKTLGLSRIELYTEHDRPLSEAERAAYRALVDRRGKREPLAYVLGEWGFRRLTLKVDSRVLVPRPETEVVVERCLALLAGSREPDVADLGTGSGAIALALVDEHPGVRVTAVDSSPDALALARENAAALGLDGRVRFVEGDMTAGFGEAAFDLVVSNPPYVGPDEELRPELEWEPRAALVGEGVTEAIARLARAALRPAGWLVLEVADGAAVQTASLLAELGYRGVTITRDLAGRERVVEGRWA